MPPYPSIPDKVILITGATSGIGLAAAQTLAGRGARLIGVGRDPARCQAAQAAITAAHPGAWSRYFQADLASQRQVRQVAASIRATILAECGAKLDVLINNAAAVAKWYTSTEDGYELQFAVNHLAPFLLTCEFLPWLQAAPFARVITVSSTSHRHGRIHWSDVMYRRGYYILRSYQQSKLANVLFTYELNRRLGEKSMLRAYAADPGLVNTHLGMKATSGLVHWFWDHRRRRGVSPADGAATLVHLAADPSVSGSRQIYWKDCRPLPPDPRAIQPADALRLWQLSERLCGVSFLS
jgi:NAD(P)-dependent dehydrogenase (short-subunit alcohol dehydrogenase family)